jgi:hypothetical protein
MAQVNELLGQIGKVLNGLPDVFSTAQWGGRAYKLPGPNGSLKRPKLLAFVDVAKSGDAVSVVFKLPPDAAQEAIGRFDWIGPFKFGALEKTGWIDATVSDGRQVRTLKRLLKVCHAMFPRAERPSGDRSRAADDSSAAANPVVRRIDRVMTQARAEGWTPPAANSKRS